MKIRQGFVSNSSSTSYVITNISDKQKTLVDFVKETPHLIDDFKEQYDWYKENTEYTQENLIKSAEENNIIFEPNKTKTVIFGDEQGTLIGRIYDYILRDGVVSNSFKVKFDEFLR